MRVHPLCLILPLLGVGLAPPAAAQPLSHEASLEAAAQALDSGRYDEADAHLERLSQTLGGEPAQRTAAGALREARVQALTAAAERLWEEQSFAAAARQLERAAELSGEGTTAEHALTRAGATAHLLAAIQLYLRQDFAAARTWAGRADTAAEAAFAPTDARRAQIAELVLLMEQSGADPDALGSRLLQAMLDFKKEAPRADLGLLGLQLARAAVELSAFRVAERALERAAQAASQAQRSDQAARATEQRAALAMLRRRVTVRTNLPQYAVEVYRAGQPQPDWLEEAGTGGVVLELYPGRYRLRVTNPDYGECAREDLEIGRSDADWRCPFDVEPVAVSLRTRPEHVQGIVIPSDMLAPRKTPFYLPLARGAYRLKVWLPRLDEPIEVPFVVTADRQQEVVLDLESGLVRVDLPAAQRNARIRLDGAETGARVGIPVSLPVGVHTLQVMLPGHVPVEREVRVLPRQTAVVETALLPMSVPSVQEVVYRASSIDATVVYGLALRSFDLTGWTAAGGERTIQRTYPLHTARIGGRFFLGGEREDLRMFIDADIGLDFATGNPIQRVLLANVGPGFGVMAQQENEWSFIGRAGYLFRYGRFADDQPRTAFTMDQVFPFGIALQADVRARWFVAALEAETLVGSAEKRSPTGAGDAEVSMDLLWVRARAFAGADLATLLGPVPGLEVSVGPSGGVSVYREERADRDGAYLATLGAVGARARLRWLAGGQPATELLVDLDSQLLGDFAPELPAIFDDKKAISARAAENVSVRAAIALHF